MKTWHYYAYFTVQFSYMDPVFLQVDNDCHAGKLQWNYILKQTRYWLHMFTSLVSDRALIFVVFVFLANMIPCVPSGD